MQRTGWQQHDLRELTASGEKDSGGIGPSSFPLASGAATGPRPPVQA